MECRYDRLGATWRIERGEVEVQKSATRGALFRDFVTLGRLLGVEERDGCDCIESMRASAIGA